MFLSLLLIGAGLRVAVWWMGGRVLPPSSDESIAMLMAGQVLQGHSPLLFMAQPYMFPLESYLAAPFALLPPGGMASRALAMLMGCLTTALALRLVPTDAPRSARWLGGGLAILPSVSVLILQGFYSLPGYSILMLLTVALPFWALRLQPAYRPAGLLAFGVIAGLGYAAHPLTICASVPAGLSLFLGEHGLRGNAKRLAWIGLGVLLGLTPYFLALWTLEGAHQIVLSTRPFEEILERIWTVGPQGAMPVALGLQPSFHPAHKAGPFLLPITSWAVACGLAWVLLVAALGRIAFHWRARHVSRWPRWQLPDLLLAIMVLNVVVFAVSPRADSGASRYFTPTALALPLLLACMAATGRGMNRATGWLVGLFLLLAQVPTGWNVVHRWQEPDYALNVSVPDLQPALDVLREQNIQFVKASYGAAYRITYLSGGSITASQPWNERFRGWTVPYRDEVLAAPRVAYVLTDAIRFLKPNIFERDLKQSGLYADVWTTGAFRVYANFRRLDEGAVLRLQPDHILAAQPHLRKMEQTVKREDTAEGITLTWTQTAALDHVIIYYAENSHRASSMTLTLRQAGIWSDAARTLMDRLTPLEWVNEQPRYGRRHKRISLKGHSADGLRLLSTCQRSDRQWNIEAIELYQRITPDT